jgi:hypothetical protein
MRLLGDDTDSTWRYFGANDPYYGVHSDKEFRREHLDEDTKRSF